MPDPATQLPALPLLLIFQSLDAANLARCAGVSRAWQRLAYNQALWDALCKSLWEDKAYVPASLMALPDRRLAWLRSKEDATRTGITEDELCTFAWNFAFKHGRAPFYDHLHDSRRLLYRYFHADHTLTAPRDDPLSHFSETPYTWSFRTIEELECDLEMTEPPGTRLYVQVNQFPVLHLSRTKDWGWQLQNMWVILTSDHRAGNNPGKGNEGSTSTEVLQAWLQMVALDHYHGVDNGEEHEEEEQGDEYFYDIAGQESSEEGEELLGDEVPAGGGGVFAG